MPRTGRSEAGRSEDRPLHSAASQGGL